MARADRPGHRARPTAVPDVQREPGSGAPARDDDITGAMRTAQAGTQETRSRLTKRQRSLAWAIIAVVLLVVLANGAVTIGLGRQLAQTTYERAEEARVNGDAQNQARQAVNLVPAANAKLQSEGLFPVDVPDVTQAPPSTVIANAASVQILASMDPKAILADDYVALGQAAKQWYEKHPVITASGPAPLQVQQLCVQYLDVASKLHDKGLIKTGSSR